MFELKPGRLIVVVQRISQIALQWRSATNADEVAIRARVSDFQFYDSHCGDFDHGADFSDEIHSVRMTGQAMINVVDKGKGLRSLVQAQTCLD